MTAAAALAALGIWSWLLVGHGGFWLARERDTRALPPAPARWPSVVAVVPARDEADVIARSVGSLARQEYAGDLRIVVVDDNSTDATTEIVRRAASLHPGEGREGIASGPMLDRRNGPAPVSVLPGKPLPAGWTGKLWAVSHGVEAAVTPDWLWLTDADIEHAPDTLASLIRRGEGERRVLVSLMARLRCDTPAERALIPAFVFFFQLLYPFGRVNRPGRTAGAAGGCMLVRTHALERAGGVGAIRGALIDDCAFGALLKRQGPVWLGLTDRSVSIRPYDTVSHVVAMIARSAYAQLDYSAVKLAGTIAGLALVYLAPPLAALFGGGLARAAGLLAWALMALAFQPTLRFYRRSPLWGVALPGIAAFYAGCTLLSAWQYAQGRGGLWKGRAQAASTR